MKMQLHVFYVIGIECRETINVCPEGTLAVAHKLVENYAVD